MIYFLCSHHPQNIVECVTVISLVCSVSSKQELFSSEDVLLNFRSLVGRVEETCGRLALPSSHAVMVLRQTHPEGRVKNKIEF